MTVRHTTLRRVTGLVLSLIIVALLAGCSSLGGDGNTFNPGGDVAEKQLEIFIIALIPAVIILILVSAALLYALIRFRRRDGDAIPKQVHGNTTLEIGWTILPTLLLVALAVPMVAAIIDLGGEPDEDALRIDVVGQQFQWVFEYPSILDDNGNPLRTFDELRIPVEREIATDVRSIDVIHSFWIPKLAGKIDAVPGRTNPLKFNANEPGTFRGQCAEFCGLRHAFMTFTVIACSEEEFEAWVQQSVSGAEATACMPDES